MCAFVRYLLPKGQYAVDVVTHARRADGCPHGRTSRKKGEGLCGVDVKFVKQLWVAVGKEERRAGGQDALWVRANNFPCLYSRRGSHPPTPDVVILSPPQAPVLSGPRAYFTARGQASREAGVQASGRVRRTVRLCPIESVAFVPSCARRRRSPLDTPRPTTLPHSFPAYQTSGA